MPRPGRSAPSHLHCAGALVLAGGLAPAGLAGNSVQWRLSAHVPVRCAILAVGPSSDRPTSLTIATACNAERFRLVLQNSEGQTGLRAARSSAGPVQISGSAITITSTRPGYALTTVELTAPISAELLSVTLQPI